MVAQGLRGATGCAAPLLEGGDSTRRGDETRRGD
jgi:hypothetical protein